MPRPRERHHRPSTAGREVRRGVITLELLLNLPIWLIVLFAGVQFGQMVINLQQVAFASRVGADVAAQDLTMVNVANAVNDHLQSAGLGTACAVILEDNVGGGTTTQTSGSCTNCDPPATPLESSRESVRVTVCVPLSSLTPDLLGSWCIFNMTTRIASQSTTFRYEL